MYKYTDPQVLQDYIQQPRFQSIIDILKANEQDPTKQAEKKQRYFTYRFTAEKIAQEAREKHSISQQHVDFIRQFNLLDQKLQINSPIDISDIPIEAPKPKSTLRTMQDVIKQEHI